MTTPNEPEPEILTKVRELEELLASITNAHAIYITFLNRGDLSVLILQASNAVNLLAQRATRAQELLTELRELVPGLVLQPGEAVPPHLVAMLSHNPNVNFTVPDDISGLEDSL